jgi:hypothetical protein
MIQFRGLLPRRCALVVLLLAASGASAFAPLAARGGVLALRPARSSSFLQQPSTPLSPPPRNTAAAAESSKSSSKSSSSSSKSSSSEGELLASCLGNLQELAYETVVIKYGGHAMGEPEARASFARDVALLQAASVRCVVVHGGGPMIAELLAKLEIPTRFEQGLRVTDEATVEVAEMVLSGKLNKRTVAEIGAAGGSAIGLSGKDDKLLA